MTPAGREAASFDQMSVLSMCASCLAIMLSSILKGQSELLAVPAHVVHCPTRLPMFAVPAVPVEEHQVHRGLAIQPLLDAYEVLDRRPRTTPGERVELLDEYYPLGLPLFQMFTDVRPPFLRPLLRRALP